MSVKQRSYSVPLADVVGEYCEWVPNLSHKVTNRRIALHGFHSPGPSPTDSRISINSAIAEQCDHSPAPPDRNERITINVGGVRHETFRSTLRIYPDTRLGWIAVNGSESIDAYDPIRNEYFFDRNPTVFTQIVNFYRTGKLHSPSDICGPLFEEELTYWGLDEKAMEPCCWSRYTEHRDAQDNLKVFDSPELNPFEEEPVHRFDQDTDSPNDSELNFVQKIIKTIYPSFFKSEKWVHFKRTTWNLFEDRSSNNIPAKIFTIISLITIVMSVLSLFFHSMLLHEVNTFNAKLTNKTNGTPTTPHVMSKLDDHHKKLYKELKLWADLLLALDILTCTWMCIEFTLRLISSPARTSFLKQILNIVDFLSILGYFAFFAVTTSSGDLLMEESKARHIISIVAIIRLFRLFRFFRLSTGLEILKHTMIASGKEILLLFLLLFIPVVIFATIVYHTERHLYETKFQTIPKAIWWAIITMTTVGYGDMSPESDLGKFFAGISACSSVIILALPVSIIGNNFQLFYHYAQARLKLPKRPKNALVGAANALVAEPSQCSMSPDMENDDSDNDSNASKKGDADGFPPGYHSQNRRFQRDRLSLYSTAYSRNSIRRSKSMGTVPIITNEIEKRQSESDEKPPNGSAFTHRVTSIGVDGKDGSGDEGGDCESPPLGRNNDTYMWSNPNLEETNMDENIPPDIVKKKNEVTTHLHNNHHNNHSNHVNNKHSHNNHHYHHENNNNVVAMVNHNNSHHSNHQQHIPRTIVTVADSHEDSVHDNGIHGDGVGEDKEESSIRRYFSPPVTRKYENNVGDGYLRADPMKGGTLGVGGDNRDGGDGEGGGGSDRECNHQCNNFLCVP